MLVDARMMRNIMTAQQGTILRASDNSADVCHFPSERCLPMYNAMNIKVNIKLMKFLGFNLYY